MSEVAKRQKFKKILNLFAPLPDPLSSYEDWERRTHQDLKYKRTSELSLEREKLGLRLKIEERPDPWLVERLNLLNRVLNGK